MHRFSLRSIAHQFVALALAGGFLFASGGCLITSSSKTEESGTKVSQMTLNQIRPGETTETWLLATAGEPSSRRAADEHTSILRYDHVTTTSSGGTVFLLFAGNNKREQSSSVIFEVRDGVIERYWTESES